MYTGKAIRMERMLNRLTRRCVIVSIPHGTATPFPSPSLTDIKKTVGEVADGGVDAVLMHKDTIPCGHRTSGRDVGLIMRLEDSEAPVSKHDGNALPSSVEEALKMGADGVSAHVDVDAVKKNALDYLGHAVRKAANWGMPLLVVVHMDESRPSGVVAHCARTAAELGADMVQIPYTGDMDRFSSVVKNCHIPVLITGDQKNTSVRALLQNAHDSLLAGGAGISVSMSVFSHPSPRMLAAALSGIVHANWSMEQALAVAGEK